VRDELGCSAGSASLILCQERVIEFDRAGMKDKNAAQATHSAFWPLVAPVKSGLYAFILKSLNFSTDADDVYQETLLSAFRYFKSFQGDKEIRPWLYSIAHNEIRRYFRKTRKQVDLNATNIPLISSPHEERALVEEIYRYAAGLKPREREIFFLFYESGFSLNEIAEITGLKSGYIKLLLHQAREHLRRGLGVFHD
jgi:RNA polymerase sigma-70 factor (ECF subfamily)